MTSHGQIPHAHESINNENRAEDTSFAAGHRLPTEAGSVILDTVRAEVEEGFPKLKLSNFLLLSGSIGAFPGRQERLLQKS